MSGARAPFFIPQDSIPDLIAAIALWDAHARRSKQAPELKESIARMRALYKELTEERAKRHLPTPVFRPPMPKGAAAIGMIACERGKGKS